MMQDLLSVLGRDLFYSIFLIARSLQLENGGLSLTVCDNMLYLLDLSSKVFYIISLNNNESQICDKNS